jgi:hypothetical protein
MKTAQRNLVSSLAVIAATALVGSSTRAAENVPEASSSPSATMQKETKAAKPTPTWVMGNIIAVKRHTVAINTENGRMRTVRIGRKTEIVIDGQKASARELKAGAPVMVTYRGHARPWAIRIEVDERKPVKAASTMEPATTPSAPSSAETAPAK